MSNFVKVYEESGYPVVINKDHIIGVTIQNGLYCICFTNNGTTTLTEDEYEKLELPFL